MLGKVFVTREIPRVPSFQRLRDKVELTVNPHDRVLTQDELLQGVAGAAGILSQLTDTIDASVMDAAGKGLRVVSNYAAGYNNIDVPAAKRRDIAVTNTPGVLTSATADLTMGLIIDVARGITRGDAYTRSGKFTGWAPKLLLGREVSGQTLGIVGFGKIGQAVARRAAYGFNMTILVHSRTEKEVNCPVQYLPFENVLRFSDFVSLHVPLNETTRHLIGTEQLNLMRPSAYLINTARGPIVDEAALVEALNQGVIAGAALDVFEEEPKVHPGLLKLPNVVIPPHIGSATFETRAAMADLACRNLLAVLEDKEPPHRIK